MMCPALDTVMYSDIPHRAPVDGQDLSVAPVHPSPVHPFTAEDFI